MGDRLHPGTRHGRLLLWLRYAPRRHEMTGRRVKGLRWRLTAGPDGRPTWHLTGRTADAEVTAGWDWPG